MTGYSDEESEDDKDSENDDEIALQWRLTGYSETGNESVNNEKIQDESADSRR